MLNRRILRIKAFKELYSYAENPSMTLKEAEAELQIACEATRDLYLYMMALIAPLTKEAADRIESRRNKFNPTEEDLHPNTRFADNAIAKSLSQDPDFAKLLSRKKMSWDQNDVFIRKLYDTVTSRSYFQSYMASEKSGIAQDAALFVKIFEDELVDSPELEAILEDMSIYWNDDLAYSLTQCCRSLEAMGKGHPWQYPPLYQSEMISKPGIRPGSDREFVTELLRSAFSGFGRYSEMVSAAVPQWDADRLFTTDVVLIVCGLAEAENFKDIPNKVTVNEYVEISKFYGTPKSRQFVNGLLDRLIKENLSLTI